MKLQLALDVLSLNDSLVLAEKTRDYVGIIEIGTPFIIEYGMEAVRQFRKKFPEKEILADVKIMDAGDIEARAAFEAGADYVTVLGATDILTVKGCVETANHYGKKVVVDMICVDDMPTKIRQLEAVGAHCLAVHTGVDQQKAGRKPIDDLRLMKDHSKSAEIFVAGGINLETIPMYARLEPQVLIVGGGICSAEDPAAEARLIFEKMMECSK